MNPIFELNNVSYRFPEGTPGLHEITLRIDPGERLAIIGPNGSGKTTLLMLLDLLLPASPGEFRYSGRPIDGERLNDPLFLHEFRSKVALVFQNSDAQIFCTNVREEIAFGPAHFAGEPELTQRVNASAATLDVTRLLDRSPVRLSSGEKKRVAIASALALQPEVLLLDEPTAGLDPRNVRALLRAIEQERERGTTLITATQDIHLVWEIADRVVVLSEDNRVAAIGGTPQILGDRALLEQHNLFHEHIHRHGDHWHRHAHEHSHTGDEPD